MKSSGDVDKQIQLESFKNDNLKLQPEIVHAQLELAQFNSGDLASPNQNNYRPPSSIATEVPSSLQNLKGSTPLSVLGQHNSAGDGHIPFLQDLCSKEKDRKQPSLLSNEYLFSAKGKILEKLEYEKLETLEFVGGFLEFIPGYPEFETQHSWSGHQLTHGVA